jgi:sec-independent protein translocase protein TatA
VLVLFGAKRLPELGRSLGTGLREFKHSIDVHPDEQGSAARAALPDTVAQPGAVAPLSTIARPTALDGADIPPAA